MNGIPTCADHGLLSTTAREDWGFDGYVTGDCVRDSAIPLGDTLVEVRYGTVQYSTVLYWTVL
jgi:hypothetical protein